MHHQAGAGKGVAVLIPNLLSYAGNCVVVDPKGELYDRTALHRKKKFGHQDYSPRSFRRVGRDQTRLILLISSIRPPTISSTPAAIYANMLVVRTGHEHEPIGTIEPS